MDFVIHLASASMARQVDYCGIYTGAKVNKFEICGWEPKPSQQVAAPTIEECPIAIECRVTEIVPMGTHDVFYADIVCVTVDEKLLDETGRLHIERADLCAYAHGQYYALGRALGRFGFSTDKKKRKNSKGKRKSGK
jgi:flavin reductase (DIM6/NTAB) family NADH-FMN oxidoreductase RutF